MYEYKPGDCRADVSNKRFGNRPWPQLSSYRLIGLRMTTHDGGGDLAKRCLEAEALVTNRGTGSTKPMSRCFAVTLWGNGWNELSALWRLIDDLLEEEVTIDWEWFGRGIADGFTWNAMEQLQDELARGFGHMCRRDHSADEPQQSDGSDSGDASKQSDADRVDELADAFQDMINNLNFVAPITGMYEYEPDGADMAMRKLPALRNQLTSYRAIHLRTYAGKCDEPNGERFVEAMAIISNGEPPSDERSVRCFALTLWGHGNSELDAALLLVGELKRQGVTIDWDWFAQGIKDQLKWYNLEGIHDPIETSLYQMILNAHLRSEDRRLYRGVIDVKARSWLHVGDDEVKAGEDVLEPNVNRRVYECTFPPEVKTTPWPGGVQLIAGEDLEAGDAVFVDPANGKVYAGITGNDDAGCDDEPKTQSPLRCLDMTGIANCPKGAHACAFLDTRTNSFLPNPLSMSGIDVFVDLADVHAHPRAEEMIPLIPQHFGMENPWWRSVERTVECTMDED